MANPVPEQDPGQQAIPQTLTITPWSPGWWVTQTVTDIPAEQLGWLLAQGWRITATTEDDTTTPPTKSYSLSRESLQNIYILQSLLEAYVDAKNTADTNNTIRYNDVVVNWSQMLETSHDHFDYQAQFQEDHVLLFLGNLTTYMDEVDTLIDANQAQIVLDADAASTALTAMDDKLAELETNVTASTTTIEGLLTDQDGYLASFLSSFISKLAELDTNYSAHLTLIESLLTEADTDLSTFATEQTTQLTALQSAYTDYASELEALIATSVADLTVATAEIDTVLNGLEAEYTSADAEVDAMLASSTDALTTFATEFDTTVDALITDYDSIASELDAVHTDSSTDLATFDSDFDTTLGTLTSDYDAIATSLDTQRTASAAERDAHVTAYEGVLDDLEPDYTTHTSVATAFLIDLGDTELARINEEFAASLAAQVQQLTDRGMASSAIITDITARSNRDRDEQIQQLNDRLNREKFDNQHRLYEQQANMRGRVLDATDRIHGVKQAVRQDHVGQLTSRHNLQQSMRDRTLAGIDRLHSATQGVRSAHYEQITSRFGMQQSARDRTLAGIDRTNAVKQEVYRFQISTVVGQYQLLSAMRDRLVAGHQNLYALREANTRFQADLQNRLYDSTQSVTQRLIDEANRIQQLRLAITQWETSTRDRLLEQVQQIEVQNLAGIDKQHMAQQEVSRTAMAERERLLQFVQDAVKGVGASKERFSVLTMQHASILADHKHRAIVEKMNESAARLNGLQAKQEEDMRLLTYQLDERNKILVGLYGFVERRDDIPPNFESLTQLSAGLADSGGGWVTP